MYSIGDVVYNYEYNIKMTVKSSNNFDNNVICIFFENGEFKETSFAKSNLVLYYKYIREKKLKSLIDEPTEETINEI